MSDAKLQWDKNEPLVKHLKPPKWFELKADRWRECLIDSCNSFGCDWLEWFMGRQGGNVTGDAVREMADRQAQLLAVARAAKEACAAFKKSPLSYVAMDKLDKAVSALDPDVIGGESQYQEMQDLWSKALDKARAKKK